MKNVEQPFLAPRRFGPRGVAAALAIFLAALSHGAETDIARTPILTTTAALVKPNVMLLMDASDSMARTHMPDEVETQTRPTSFGYKSSQCNALYYNPAQPYFLPKRFDGTPFPLPPFGAAPYAGFGSFYAVPETRITILSSQFVAYEGATLENRSFLSLDTPQKAYYFVYSGAQTLRFANAPCTDPDVSLPSTAGTFPASGGGTWTKVLVTSLSAAEQQNFANWYSFYRTRISLIKSAASLTFAPLTDTKRVGFITVLPKASPGAAGIAGTAPNWPRYLPIDDFNSGAGAQKDLWFAKLFSQVPSGTSPAREGLARVGRYYGGQEDSINTNMPATGPVNDPVKYACQQNFTIMTTDGYWNGQAESKGPGLYGGGLMLDGVTKVGQQDGNLSDPYSPRPIWDGFSDSVHVVTDKTNAYTDNLCSLASRYRSTFQTQREVSTLTRDSTRTTKRTVQYTESKSQVLATTTQTSYTLTYDMQTTEQFALRRVHFVEEHYRHMKWQEQTTKVSEQFELETRQRLAQTFQTRQIDKRIWQTREQWQTAKSQSAITTTQYKMQQDQFLMGRAQVYKHQYQTKQKLNGEEYYSAIEGECRQDPGDLCQIEEYFPTQLVDPSTCTTGPGPTVGGGPGFLKTTCIDGPLTRPYGPVDSCSPPGSPPTAPNFVAERCDRIVGTPTAFNGTCVDGQTTQDSGPTFYIYICSRPPATNALTPVASCGAYPAATAPDWITTTCGQPAGPNNQPLAPSLSCSEGTFTDGAFVTTTCTKTINTAGYVAACVSNPGTSGSFIKVTCGVPETLADNAVAAGSCTLGDTDMGTFNRHCEKNPVAPYPSPTAVSACTDGPGANPDFFETVCTSNNQIVFTTAAGCGTLGITPAAGPDWTYRDCRNPAGPTNRTEFADPRTCVNNPGTSGLFIHVTCTTATTMMPTAVPPSACPLGPPTYDGGPGFTVTHCDRQDVSPPTNVAACAVTDPEVPPYTVTLCGTSSVDTPVASCVLDSTYVDGVDTVTCVKPSGPNNAGPVQVPLCTAQSPTATEFVRVTCAGPTTQPRVVIAPDSCANGTYLFSTYYMTCSTDAVAPYLVPTPVASCINNSVDGSNVKTSCSYPAVNNYAAIPVAPCTEGTTVDGPTQVRTTCAKTDTTDPVPTSACPADVAQTGSGPAITCTTTTTLAEPVTSCTPGAVQATAPFDTTTACHPLVTSPMADYAGACTAGPTGPPGEVASCGRRAIDVLVADAGCVDSTSPSGLITECTPGSGGGHHYTRMTTTTVTTTPFSGTSPTGPDAVTTSSVGPVDVGPVCSPISLTFPPKPPVDVAGCTVWPCTQVTATSGGSENSLADVAQYYYRTDLRPSMDDKVPSAGTGLEDDKAPHQHMTTFVVGLGVSGTLNFRADYRSTSTTIGDFADIRTGAKNWPLWPDPALDQPLTPCAAFPSPPTNTYQCNSDLYNNPKSIDDFWHTAVNGRGRYFNGNDPTSVIQGLGDALAKISDVVASGTADAVSTFQPVSGNNFAFSTSYQSGSWQGDVEARLLDLVSGAPGAPVWSAKALLGTHTFANCDDRKILLMHTGTSLVNFTWNTTLCPGGLSPAPTPDGLDTTEKAFFGPLNVQSLTHFGLMTDGTGGTAAQQAEAQLPGKLVNFLRGQRGNEDFQSNSLTKLFRHREAVLGDIVDSQPVYVGQPFANYQENNYAGFKFTPRAPMLYVGANDGMLHAFHGNVTGTNAGQEAWAVIPSAVLPSLYKLADDNYKRDGHQFYVDGTPVAGDVWDNTNWHTIVVGGLNAGGRGYYALDVTIPGAIPIPLWEFKQNSASCPAPAPALMPSGVYSDCNLGLTFGKPIITKLAGNWVVILTSGYNNSYGVAGDGLGYVYVLDALTGELKQKIATTAGSGLTPSGLAQLNNYVDNVNIDNATLRAYGGDVLGNIWRFDFSPPSATLLGTAKDLADVVEPITIRPELAELDGKPFVMVGTGRFLGGSDVGVTGTQKQSVYGFRDPLTAGSGPIYDPMRTFLRPMAITQVGTGATAVRTLACAGSAGDCSRSAGWVIDLPEVGERVTVEMKVILGALIFSSNVPEQVPCSIGGHSWLNAIDFRTGKIVPGPGSVVSQFLGDTLNVGFNILELPAQLGGSSPTRTVLYRQSDAHSGNAPFVVPEPTALGKRISWREIAQ